MTPTPIHTIETAPEGSRAALAALSAAFGFTPNIAGALAHSPTLINGLVALFGPVHGGSFTEREIQVVLLTDAVTNGAEWAVAFHSALAGEAGVDSADVAAIRDGALPAPPRFAALSDLARTLIATRGHPAEAVTARFLAAGFTDAQLLEVVAIVAASVITNYTSSLARPPLEARFAAHRWEAPRAG